MSAREALTWVVPDTNEAFDDYEAYVQRLVDLRRPPTDVVLTAYGAITYPKSDKPDRPIISNEGYDIVTFDTSPDEALQRLSGCEFHSAGLPITDRVQRLQREVAMLLLQSTDQEFGAAVVGELKQLRADLQRLSNPEFGSGFIDRTQPEPGDDSLLKQHERVSKLEKALESSTLSTVESLLEELEGRMSLLAESKLDRIAAKSRQAIAQMQLLSKESSTNVNLAAFDELRNAVARWDDVAGAVPHLIERLLSVKHLHEHSADIMNRLEAVEHAVHVAGENLQRGESAVVAMERSLADNLKIMEANCTALVQRLQRLESK